jgi:CheY-like chemotaxis protein
MGPVSTVGTNVSGGLILVVEDDPLILEFLCEILQDEGFVVQPQISADAASAYLEQNADNVRLLLTDITMPGTLNGADLANQFGDRWPEADHDHVRFRNTAKRRCQAFSLVYQKALGTWPIAGLRRRRLEVQARQLKRYCTV